MRTFLCMFNTDSGQYNGVYETVDGQIDYSGDGIKELFGMNPREVEIYFYEKGEAVQASYEQFS